MKIYVRGGRNQGKSEVNRKVMEAALRAGMTVAVCSGPRIVKWKRVWRKGRSFDVVETVR